MALKSVRNDLKRGMAGVGIEFEQVMALLTIKRQQYVYD